MSTGTSRRGAFGLALLPFAGNLTQDQDLGEESNAAEAGTAFRLEAQREDGSTVLATSPIRLDDVEAALAGAGFRIHRHSAPKRRAYP